MYYVFLHKLIQYEKLMFAIVLAFLLLSCAKPKKFEIGGKVKEVIGYAMVIVGTITGTNLILGGVKKWQRK